MLKFTFVVKKRLFSDLNTFFFMKNLLYGHITTKIFDSYGENPPSSISVFDNQEFCYVHCLPFLFFC